MSSRELEVNYPDPGFWTQTSLIQLGYGVWVNLTMVTIGLAYGFSAVAIPQLTSPGSPIKVTISDESWIGRLLQYLLFFFFKKSPSMKQTAQ